MMRSVMLEIAVKIEPACGGYNVLIGATVVLKSISKEEII